VLLSPDPGALSREACIRLLGDGGIARVGLSVGSLPVILPVNYVVDGGRVVFRTGEGSKLDAAVRHAVVCVEVDHLDEERRAGWSVLVTGEARPLADAEVSPEARRLLLPWFAAAGGQHVGVPLDIVTGRRVGTVPVDR
jgi:nitroimidazol reductase NimA-like FMN-containing flavoprotein (pyridoxamine 5'-phosphate oxidase superfamily)